MLLPKPVHKISMASLPWRRLLMAISCSGFKTTALFPRRIFKSDNALVNTSAIFWFCFDKKICSVSRNSPKGIYQNIWVTGEHSEPIGTIRTLAYGPTQKSPPSVQAVFKLLPPQSPHGFSALARFYYLETKTAMLRRLVDLRCLLRDYVVS